MPSHNKEILVNIKIHYSIWEINVVALLLLLSVRSKISFSIAIQVYQTESLLHFHARCFY